MKRVEISQEMLDGWINTYLVRNGFDPTKEIKCHAMFGPNQTITQVYTQEENAPLKPEIASLQKLENSRPEWLKGRTK